MTFNTTRSSDKSSDRPKFTYLGHATVRVDLPTGEVVLIDPWVEHNPRTPEEHKSFERIDAMLITHGHFDHMGDAVSLAKEYRPKVVVATFEVCNYLESKGVENCSGMNIGGSQEVLGLKVTQVQALHTSSIDDDGTMLYGGNATGYIVKHPPSQFTFYHSGDTALFLDMQLFADFYRPQLAFLPVGDHFTMDPAQAARACKFLEVPKVVPIHWGTFPLLTGTPEALKRELDAAGVNCEVVTLQPGESH